MIPFLVTWFVGSVLFGLFVGMINGKYEFILQNAMIVLFFLGAMKVVPQWGEEWFQVSIKVSYLTTVLGFVLGLFTQYYYEFKGWFPEEEE